MFYASPTWIMDVLLVAIWPQKKQFLQRIYSSPNLFSTKITFAGSSANLRCGLGQLEEQLAFCGFG